MDQLMPASACATGPGTTGSSTRSAIPGELRDEQRHRPRPDLLRPRRQLVRRMLTAASRQVDEGGPIIW